MKKNPFISIWDRVKRKINCLKALLLRRSSLVTLWFLGILVIVWFIWQVPQWQASGINNPKDRATIENAARGTLVQALGGLFLFVTAYLSFQNLKVTQQNLVATQEKQVTERFAKAIEQLGNQNIHVRLGAIYALERIAKDSDRDYWQVMEVLTAYVRECSPRSLEPYKKTTVFGENTDETGKEEAQHIPPLATDIQAVLTVLSRCKQSYLNDENQNQRLDLRETDLRRLRLYEQSQLCRAILSRANLEGADLRETDLRAVDLREANLQHVHFPKVKLQEAFLYHAKLQSSHLQGAELQGAKLRNANLQNTDLKKANLERAEFVRANLQDASLRKANLKGALLTLANLKRAWLDEANLQQADLRGANMQGANLLKANLQKAIFWIDNIYIYDDTNSQRRARTNLEGANLKEADLSNTDLRNVDGLTWEQLEDAKSYAGALLPDYLNQKK